MGQGRSGRAGGAVPGGAAADVTAMARELERLVRTEQVTPNAPYSADATTTMTQVLADGTRIEQSTSARFYRDSAGRTRREQTIVGLGPLNASGNAQSVTIDPDPGDGFMFVLDAAARTARRVMSGLEPLRLWMEPADSLQTAAAGLRAVRRRRDSPAGGVTQNLTREIDGLKATGTTYTTTIPVGQIGNDRPIEITEENWESVDLKVVIYARHHDPRTGTVEYKLTNISRQEPPPDLFVVPPDYTVVGAGQPGLRGGGGRGAPAGDTGPVGGVRGRGAR
jgi:hypothetical protein